MGNFRTVKKKFLTVSGAACVAALMVLACATLLLVACPDPGTGPGTSTNVETGINTAELTFTGTSAKISWQEISGTTTYDIYHAGSRLGSYTYVDSVDNVEFSVPAKYINENKYDNYYKIVGVDAGGKEKGILYASEELTLFGPNVRIYNSKYDKITDIQAEINSIHDKEMFGSVPQGDGRNGEFSSKRYVLFFRPGTYEKHDQFRIGFYTHIAGLGKLPTETTLQGTITTPPHLNQPDNPNNATCTFWRSSENYQLSANGSGNEFRWGVSQSAPIRRMQVNIPAYYHYFGGWCSGGFTADVKFTNVVDGDSQQQWYTRNTDFATSMDGVGWNKVIQGSTGRGSNVQDATGPGYSVIENTPIIREKPFIFYDGANYKVFVPALRYNAKGISWGDGKANNGMGEGTILDLFTDFYIARAGRDTATTINEQLETGKHIYFTPGRYEVSTPIRVTKPGTIVLGNGFPTLFPADNNPYGALFIDDVDNVTVAGLMFDATPARSTYLLAAGNKDASADHSANPTLLADLCLRVGGYYSVPVHADIAAFINSNNVIGDKFWVWRADHGVGALIDWDKNTSRNGVVVRGNDVTIYGLFCEHFHEYNTLWMGERGKVFFYQNELPYDPHYQNLYKSHNGTVDGWSAFKVANNVNEFYAIGLGMYCVFLANDGSDHTSTREPIYVQNAMEVPHKEKVVVENACTVYIGSPNNGGIRSIINGTGQSVENNWGPGQVYVEKFVNGKATGTPANRDGVEPADEEHLTWLQDRSLLP